MLKFKHSGSVGDLLLSLWCVRDMISRQGDEQGNLYLQTGIKAQYLQKHPSGNQRMNRQMAEALLPLLRSQPYLNEVEIWDGREIDVDLDLFRCLQIDYHKGSIPKYYFWTFQSWADVSEPCLVDIKPDEGFRGRLVVGRTNRYQNPRINYRFLDAYEPVFLGLEEEYEAIKEQLPNAEYCPTNDLLEVAQILKAAKCYVGNQSAIFAVAECLKVPRVLETDLLVQNVIPAGPGARDAINQLGLEWHTQELMGAE